jgi:hypothetical protein
MIPDGHYIITLNPTKNSHAGIVSDCCTEFTGRAILKWTSDNGIEWHHIDPSKPQQTPSSNHSTAAYEMGC